MSHLYRRGDLYWYATYVAGRKVRRPLGTRNKRLAQARKAELDLQYARAHPLAPHRGYDITFEDATVRYLAATARQHTPMWHYVLERRLRHLTAILGSVKLADLGPEQLGTALNRLTTQRKLHAGTQAAYFAMLRSLSRWAVTNGLLITDITQGVAKPRPKDTERIWLSKAQRDALLTLAKPSPQYPLVLAALYTGARWRELVTLEWTSIDFERRTVTIQPQHAKSGRARVIPLHPALEAVLRPLKRPSGAIFGLPTRIAYAEGLREVRRWFRTIKLKGDRLGYHVFRHTFVSLLLQEGASLWDVAGWAGHSDARVTQKRYAHRLPAYNPAIERL